MFLCKSLLGRDLQALEEDGVKPMDITGTVLYYPEKKKRFKCKIRKCGVKKDKPTKFKPSRRGLSLEGYLI
jgi:hypothetical protein